MIDFIVGGVAKDDRGQIRFVNDFDMSLVKRFYIIKNANTELVRGWRAHRIEQRWFYVLSGSFAIDLVKINNWDKPDPQLSVEHQVLQVTAARVMHVPAGYGTAFQALEAGSELLVFSDYEIAHASNDDYVFPVDYFLNRKAN